ncbi:pyridoxamine 5'-phosphate oxidase family protein [Gordonia sp. zg691]|uniref:pyridoxine/pyridoxamine 5'-phosphate oxidase n=1 Tax=Gordonia jinghuaiqii TaxID=2758710 RepID=UPI00166279D3|nr:pyridoxamine 5'-phosphate oxidase family protein [Gordonia jinghuaiqii]MBD0863535.1 pyridoxamine 5'-phosphate oxidase family protein [Gordonia jinghuaiqii]
MITSGTHFGTDCAAEDQLSIDPMVLLNMWLPAPDAPRPLMALATCGRDGYPRVRHVLLSEADDTSIYFHTDSRSSKVAELADTPRASIAVAWPEQGRQVVAHGDVRRAPDGELRQVFSRRNRYLQLLAWLNDDDLASRPPDERRRRWAEFDDTHADLTPPATWTGFAVDLQEVTFWRGDPDGPSQRIRFARNGDERNPEEWNPQEWNPEVLPG